MTNIEARAIENARFNLRRAQKEHERAMLRDTHYRGVRTVITKEEPQTPHGVFTYRGVVYNR